jgi:pimeloyl-ACP methyl ester carboxylesterase
VLFWGALPALAIGGVVSLALSGFAPGDCGASAILRPLRRPVTRTPDLPHQLVTVANEGERLEGWLFRPATDPHGFGHGLVVYLHGIADNRQSGIGVAQRLVPRGYALLALDARAHGRSTGTACTYGAHERRDVSAALSALGARQAVLIGHSLGAAVALQAAATDRRVVGVVAASAFSDLPTIVRERAGWFHLPGPYVDAALARAGHVGNFSPSDASPVALAPRIRVPVLLLHGDADRKTPPAHSRRIAGALGSPHRVVLLPGAGHDEVLGLPEAWSEIDRFLESLPAEPAP